MQGKVKFIIIKLFSGSWLSYLEIDGLLYWRFEDKFEEWKTLDELLLPSDASRRLDK